MLASCYHSYYSKTSLSHCCCVWLQPAAWHHLSQQHSCCDSGIVRQTNTGTFALQCVAFDGRDQVLAAGDASGRIMLWHNFADHLVAAQQQQQAARKEQQAQQEALLPPPRATWHWHAHAVRCLVFSSDSTYLMSGGQEAVMVGACCCTALAAVHDHGDYDSGVGATWLAAVLLAPSACHTLVHTNACRHLLFLLLLVSP